MRPRSKEIAMNTEANSTKTSADSDRYSNRYWVLFYQHIAAQASEREADERAMQELHSNRVAAR
jgi:hypothetical protein